MRTRRIGYVMAAAGVVVAFNLALPASAALTVQHFWHTGEDNQVLPTDSVGAKPFTGGFGTMAVDAAIFAPGSTKSVSFAADGGSYMDSLGDGITVPSDNWVYELWARPTTTNGASITTLGSDQGTAQIGIFSGNWYFGEFFVTFGENSQPVTANAWTHLAWVRDGGTNRFFINGVQIGSNSDSLVNNGRIHLGVKPGNGEWLAGNLDEIRFSTFGAGQFSANDLLVNSTPEPSAVVVIGIVAGAMTMIRRRRA